MHVEDSCALEGELRWDPERGHARRLRLRGTTKLEVRDASESTGRRRESTSAFEGEVRLETNVVEE